jgi:hypothetical protein
MSEKCFLFNTIGILPPLRSAQSVVACCAKGQKHFNTFLKAIAYHIISSEEYILLSGHEKE